MLSSAHLMHLRFSEEELATLIEMVSLATEVANINPQDKQHAGYARFEGLENKILESAKHHGMGSVIEFDQARGKNRVTEAFQQESFFQECLEEFRDASFWEELMIRLAERDVLREVGEAAFLALSDEEKEKLTKPQEKRYWQKFSTKGIGQLHWIEQHEEG